MTALCENCLSEVPSRFVEREYGIWIEKACPTHGPSEHLVEPDKDFWHMTHSSNAGAPEICWSTSIDVTGRCNLRCPQCYREPNDQESDPSINDLVSLSMKIKKGGTIALMGAEPTMRDDLPELIPKLGSTTGMPIGIYTNAIRLSDGQYAEQLAKAGLAYALVSLHTPDYLGKPYFFQKKVEALRNMLEAGIHINHVSFTLRSLEELPEVVNYAMTLSGLVPQVRIRSPFDVGTCTDRPFFLSELFKRTVYLLRQGGQSPYVLRFDNNGYHIMIQAGGLAIRLIRCPSIEAASLDLLRAGPWALFVPEAGEINLLHSVFLQTALRQKSRVTGMAVTARRQLPMPLAS